MIYSLVLMMKCGTFFMMKQNEGTKSKPSGLIGIVLNYPARLVERMVRKIVRIKRCEFKGETILLHHNLFKTDTFQISQIRSWAVYPEMGFDVVRIELLSGEVKVWIDGHDELPVALRRLVQGKESSVG